VSGNRLAVLSLLLLPLLWLWPSVFGGRTFVPYDTAQFPPVSLGATAEQLAAARDGANSDVTEVPVWFLPELRLARADLAAGRLPTWNPHARNGAPLHAHGLLGLLYPPNWLALAAADPADGLVLVAWVNLALAGLLAFGLLRALALPTLPAWFGAVLFQLSAPMATNAFFWMRLASLLWLPGVLWAVLATAAGDRWRSGPIAALAATFALAWLGGFPPFAITTTTLGVAFAGWLVVARWRADGVRAARMAALRLMAGFAVGGCLAAPQVLPSAAFFPQSARPTSATFAEVGHGTFEVPGLLGYVAPDALGHPSATAEVPYGPQNVVGLLWSTRRQPDGKPALPNFNYTEYAVFVGSLGIVLALLGAVLGRGRHRGFAIAAWALCLGAALLVPIVRLGFHLPVVQNVIPMRWLPPATIFVAWLAALGLQRLLAALRMLPLALGGAAAAAALALVAFTASPAAKLDERPDWPVQALAAKYQVGEADVRNHVLGVPPVPFDRFRFALERLRDEGRTGGLWLLGAGALLAAFAALRTSRLRTTLGVAAGLASVVQLGMHGASVTRGSLCATSTETTVHTFLRAAATARAREGGFMVARGSVAPELPAQLPPGQLLTPGLRDLHFYTHYDGRSLQPLRALLGAFGDAFAAKGYLERSLPAGPPGPVELPGLFAHPLFDLLGVRYVLSVGSAPLPHAGTPIVVPGAPPGFVVQERTTALPRAFAVDAVQAAANDDAVVHALLAPDFAPLRVAHALAADLPETLPAAGDPTAARRDVAFAIDVPTHIELEVGAGAQPWLLLVDAWLPGWTATIDGVVVPIVRGDHAFRLVRLPPQACRVAFRYEAPGLAAGGWLAVLGLLGLLVSAFATRTPAGTTAMSGAASSTP